MNLYYLELPYAPTKHRIVKAVYDADVFKFDTGTLSPYNILTIDELDPVSKALCLDLYNTQGRVDVDGENKYHVNAQGALVMVVNWQEVINEVI